MEQEQKYNFKWWARCKLNGLTCSFSGTTPAKDAREASDSVDTMLREKYPDAKWMHGRNVEDAFVTYLPTVQRGKLIKGKTSAP
jgi:hypothetical protein